MTLRKDLGVAGWEQLDVGFIVVILGTVQQPVTPGQCTMQLRQEGERRTREREVGDVIQPQFFNAETRMCTS